MPMRLDRGHALLFDFDGTIADSPSLHEAAFRAVLRDVHPELLEGFCYDAVLGMETSSVFRQLGVAEDMVSLCTTAKRKAYADYVGAGHLKFMPGADTCLNQLAAMGCDLYIATSGSRGSVTAALEALGLTNTFRGVVTSTDVSHGKPAPDIFQKLLRDFSIAPENAVVIEDALSGVTAARAAGLRVIGVYNSDLEGVADIYLAGLCDLPALLEGHA